MTNFNLARKSTGKVEAKGNAVTEEVSTIKKKKRTSHWHKKDIR